MTMQYLLETEDPGSYQISICLYQSPCLFPTSSGKPGGPGEITAPAADTHAPE